MDPCEFIGPTWALTCITPLNVNIHLIVFQYVHIFREHVTVTKEEVRIPFATPIALTDTVASSLTCFAMDFTFNTNVEGLLLGAAGLVCGTHLYIKWLHTFTLRVP